VAQTAMSAVSPTASRPGSRMARERHLPEAPPQVGNLRHSRLDWAVCATRRAGAAFRDFLSSIGWRRGQGSEGDFPLPRARPTPTSWSESAWPAQSWSSALRGSGEDPFEILQALRRDCLRSFIEIEHLHRNAAIVTDLLQSGGTRSDINVSKARAVA